MDATAKVPKEYRKYHKSVAVSARATENLVPRSELSQQTKGEQGCLAATKVRGKSKKKEKEVFFLLRPISGRLRRPLLKSPDDLEESDDYDAARRQESLSSTLTMMTMLAMLVMLARMQRIDNLCFELTLSKKFLR